MKPLVSILVPAFNTEEFLAEALTSALAQTWPRTEIIVVDDGSTDGTPAIARRFASGRVKVVAQEHQGAAAARNAAFALSQGDFIQWLDSDDLLAPEKVERQLSRLLQQGHRTFMASGPWGRFMYRPSRARFVPTGLWRDLPAAEWLLGKLGRNEYMQTATWLVSRELAEAAGPWDTRLVVDDDGEFFCRVLLASDGVLFVPDAKVFYRLRGSERLSYIGRSNGKPDAQFLSMLKQIECLRTLEDSERVRTASIRYLQTSLPQFHPHRPDIVEEVERLASALGGALTMPRLPWKYSWIAAIAGAGPARRAQAFLPLVRWSIARRLDKLLSLRSSS